MIPDAFDADRNTTFVHPPSHPPDCTFAIMRTSPFSPGASVIFQNSKRVALFSNPVVNVPVRVGANV